MGREAQAWHAWHEWAVEARGRVEMKRVAVQSTEQLQTQKSKPRHRRYNGKPTDRRGTLWQFDSGRRSLQAGFPERTKAWLLERRSDTAFWDDGTYLRLCVRLDGLHLQLDSDRPCAWQLFCRMEAVRRQELERNDVLRGKLCLQWDGLPQAMQAAIWWQVLVCRAAEGVQAQVGGQGPFRSSLHAGELPRT